MNKTKTILTPLVALLFVFGVMVSGAGAQVTSGAAGFNIISSPDETSVGGDPVNLTIQVLNSDLAVNTPSSGQVGDVLFSITSSLATSIDLIGNPGASTPAGPGNGWFAAINANNLAPGAGLVMSSLIYGGAAGVDTVTVRMFEAVVNFAGNVVAGAQIGDAVSFDVTVREGEAITAITNIVVLTNVDPNDIDGDGTYADQEEDVAGEVVGLQVTTPLGESGTVTVELVGINVADVFGNNAAGETLSTDITVSNGIGNGVVTVNQAGYYEIRGSSDSVNFIKLDTATIGANDLIGSPWALRIRPDVPSNLTLSLQKPVVGVGGSGSNATVRRVDDLGNRSGYADPSAATPVAAAAVDITFTASNANVTVPAAAVVGLIPAGAAGGALPAAVLAAAAGNSTVTVSAPPVTGLTDSPAAGVISAAAPITAAFIDDGTGAPEAPGPVIRGVGQTLRVSGITGAGLGPGQPVSLRLGSTTLTSTLAAAAPFSADFTLPTSSFAPTQGVLSVGNATLGSYLLGSVAEGDNTLQAVAAAGSTVMLVNPNGFDLAGFNAGFRGRTFNVPNTGQNAHFRVEDQFGNNVTFAASGLSGTLTASDLVGGNNSVVNLGTDAFSDGLLQWASAFSGDATVTLTPVVTSGIDPITFDVANVGTATFAEIAITIPPLLPGDRVLSNTIIPVVIETFNSTGTRTSLGQNFNLIITLETTETVATLVDATGAGPIANGSLIDTNSAGGFNRPAGDNIDGRLAIGLASGNTEGTLRIKVQTTDGSVVAETGDINVIGKQPPPIPGVCTDITASTTVAADECVTLMVTRSTDPNLRAEWFAFTASFLQPVFLLSDANGVIALGDVADLRDDTYSYPNGDTVITLEDGFGSIGFQSGDTFSYAYAAGLAALDTEGNDTGNILITVGNIIVVTIE